MVKASGKQVITARLIKANPKPRLNDGHGSKNQRTGKLCNHPNCELNSTGDSEGRKSPHFRKGF